jgi:hypothetical protein
MKSLAPRHESTDHRHRLAGAAAISFARDSMTEEACCPHRLLQRFNPIELLGAAVYEIISLAALNIE